MAESEQTSSVEMMAQDESVGQARPESVPEQPAAQDSESVMAVAVLDTPAAETSTESAIAAAGSEISVAESVMDAQEQDTEPVDTASASGPVGAADLSNAESESGSQAATIVSDGAKIQENDPGAEVPQDSISPMDTPAEDETETIPVSESGNPESAEPGAVVDVESTQVAVEDASTAIESETSASPDVADEGVSEAEQPENVEDIPLETPILVGANTENEVEEKRPAIEPLSVSPIPVQLVFLPVQSSQNRPGYALRGLF